MQMELLFLGTGTSGGVPEIGCKCPVCTSDNPRNRRLRSSVLIKTGSDSILIDTSPDLRTQALTYNIDRVDAVCYTHYHADHIFGIDELRKYNSISGCAIPCYVSQEMYDFFQTAFSYILNPNPNFKSYIPQLEMHVFDGAFSIGGTEIVPVEVRHAGMKVFGFRIGDMAYLTDCNHIPDASRELLHGLKILVLDALRHSYHVSHFSLDNAIREALEIGAEQTYFTHIAHDIDHTETSKMLPKGIQLAYDGLVLRW